MASDKDGEKTVFKPNGPKTKHVQSLTSDDAKTIIKSQPVQSDTSRSDKTRIAPKPHKSDQPATTKRTDEKLFSSETFAKLSPEEQNKVARLAAQRKRERIESGEQSDKTEILTRSTGSDESDKTQIVTPNLANVESAKTIITSTPASDQTGDYTPSKPPVMLKNRFQLEAVLGAGGMGVVYKAKDNLKVEAQDRDPYVAIKVLGEEFKSHPEAFIALQRESRKTQRIAHPNIVNVHDFDRDGDTVFMTMEFLEGDPLDKIISKYKSTGLPEDMAWEVLKGLSAALVHAHNEKIIHSDFKPGNIFVTDKGMAKVFDFGIARAVANAENLEESVDDKTVFDAGNLGALTPAYASLEMLNGETPDVRDDIYALGCIAYELFTGKHPYNRLHATDAEKQKIKPKRIPNLTKKQSRIIEKAVAFKREDRIATVNEFWSLLIAKKAPVLLISAITLSFAAIIAFAGFQYYQGQNPQNDFSADEARSEIEMQLRLEGHKEALESLIASALFNPRWEEGVWVNLQGVAKFVASDDAYYLENKKTVYNLYRAKIAQTINEKSFDLAKTLLSNAERYTDQTDELVLLAKSLEDAIGKDIAEKAAEKKRLANLEKKRKSQVKQQVSQAKQEEEVKARRVAFDTAMATVDKQLTCRSLNMRDFQIAIDKLRSLNATQYSNQEPRIIKTLAACITRIGKSVPERAEKHKILALRTFPKSSAIASIKIVPRDPCAVNLAGLGAKGARAACRDKLDAGGRSPSMVVIPAKGSIPVFAMAKYEVTVAEYNNYCSASDECSTPAKGIGDNPATNISAQEIKRYLAWLSDNSGKTYRLPTKAEWLYAAKAKSGREDSNRNCELNSRGIQKGKILIKATIGQANEWGLISMVGNARELVSRGSSRFLALGGSFQTPMEECRISTEQTHTGQPDSYTGFRFLREIDTQN